MKEERSKNLKQYPLLNQITKKELEKLVHSYKSILTLAKLVFPFLVIIIFVILGIRIKIFSPHSSDLSEYILPVIVVCVIWFILLVPFGFYKICSLRSKVYKKAEQIGVNKDNLLDEFIIYLHATIKNHHGVNLK